MIELVISGGQTGADQAAWRAARAANISTGGFMPKGFITEAGDYPEFADIYGAREHHSSGYVGRTRDNVRSADLTIVFDTSRAKAMEGLSRGSQLALRTAMQEDRPSIVAVVQLGQPIHPRRTQAMARRIVELGARTVNVGGNRESKAPGIGEWVEAYLAEVFRILRESPPAPGSAPTHPDTLVLAPESDGSKP